MGNNGSGTGKVSTVIPALNESDGISRPIQAIPGAELEDIGYEVHVLAVDNGSDNGTAGIASGAGAEVILEPKRGYGNAYKAGFAEASGDIIATADADTTYPLEDICRLVKLLEGEKVAYSGTKSGSAP